VIAFTEQPSPHASIVIIGLREAPLLLTCLQSIAENVEHVTYEVIVVLNDPTDRLSSAVQKEVSGARINSFRANLGFGLAINHAAAAARGRYLVLLNDDCTVTGNWLESLIDVAEHRPHCGMVGSKLVNPDGTLQEAGAVIWSDGITAPVCGEGSFANLERRVDYCSASSLLIRKDLWNRLGGFDERYYPAYYEDVDLCLRASEGGWEVWYQPRSVVYHQRSKSTTPLERGFLHQRAHKLFVNRWSEFLSHQAPPGDLEGAVLQAMSRPLSPGADEQDGPIEGSSPSSRTSAPEEVCGPGSEAPRTPSEKREEDKVVRVGNEVASNLPRPGDEQPLAELEIDALRRELQIRLEYNAALERNDAERQRHTDWLYEHIEHITHVFDNDRQRAAAEFDEERRRDAAEHARAAAELRCELESERRATAEARRSLQEMEQVLAAERARLSYVLVERMAARRAGLVDWLRKVRGRAEPPA
jgi:GT2 family glycosyltransferase